MLDELKSLQYVDHAITWHSGKLLPMNSMSRSVRWVARKLGYNLVRCQSSGHPLDTDVTTAETIDAVRDFTKTSSERISSLIEAVQFTVMHDTPGDFVECGVWRGGSMMAVAQTLLNMGVSNRDLYLFDTYEGMVAPTDNDVSRGGVSASSKFAKRAMSADSSDWCFATLEDVQANMLLTGYPEARMHFIKGKVEETIPAQSPEQISVLRLDTDWYESTKHEMQHLYPSLVEGGFLIIDDYGDWLGAKKAVDEYIESNKLSLFLHRIDDTGRLAIKRNRAA